MAGHEARAGARRRHAPGLRPKAAPGGRQGTHEEAGAEGSSAPALRASGRLEQPRAAADSLRQLRAVQDAVSAASMTPAAGFLKMPQAVSRARSTLSLPAKPPINARMSLAPSPAMVRLEALAGQPKEPCPSASRSMRSSLITPLPLPSQASPARPRLPREKPVSRQTRLPASATALMRQRSFAWRRRRRRASEEMRVRPGARPKALKARLGPISGIPASSIVCRRACGASWTAFAQSSRSLADEASSSGFPGFQRTMPRAASGQSALRPPLTEKSMLPPIGRGSSLFRARPQGPGFMRGAWRPP